MASTKPPSPPSKISWDKLSSGEQFSVIWQLFRVMDRITDIHAAISEAYDVPSRFNRESIYKMMRTEARQDRLRYLPKLSDSLAGALRQQYPWLKEIVVAHTTRFEDVAYHGAQKLIETLKQTDWIHKPEVHIGFAGGHAMRLLVQIFARMLSETQDALPHTLVLHALVAGFDVHEPTTDPNTFFTLFQDETKFSTHFKFVGLQAPPRVNVKQYASFREMDWFRESYKHAKKLDIILTSAANWSDEHSTFRKSMKQSKNCFEVLDNAGCQGDMLWLPVGQEDPLKVETEIRSMTLLQLNELAEFVRKGKSVYLVLGTCAGCGLTKTSVLSAVLSSRTKLISHLISDIRTVRGVLNPTSPSSR